MTSDSDDSTLTPEPRGGVGQVGKLARQSALLLSSGVLGYAGALGLDILLARQLGAGGFGAYAVAFSAAVTTVTLGMLGADWMIQRHGSYFQGIGDTERLRRTVHLALLLSTIALIVLGGALSLAAPFFAVRVFRNESMTNMLRVAGVMIPIIGVGQVMLLGTRAFKNMRETAAIRNIVQPGARVVFVAVALLAAQTQLSAFVGLLCAELLTTCAATWSLHRKLPLVGPTKPIAMGEMMTFALPAWGTRLLETLRGQMFPLLLGSLVRLSASAAFVASSRIAVIPSAIIGTINTAYTPMVGDLHMQNRRGDLLALSKGVGKWSFMLGFPIFCLQVSFPTEILSLFGPQFRAATPALIVLAIGMLFNFSTGPSTRTLMAAGRSRLALIDYIIVLSVEIGLSLWLIPSVGLLGAAIARATGSALNNGLPLWQVWRLERLHPYTWDYWKPLVAGVTGAVAARVIVSASGLGDGLVSALAGAATLSVTYLLVIILLRLSEEDQAVIRGLIQRMRRRPRPAAAGGSTSLE